jgi:hypothetical protein
MQNTKQIVTFVIMLGIVSTHLKAEDTFWLAFYGIRHTSDRHRLRTPAGKEQGLSEVNVIDDKFNGTIALSNFRDKYGIPLNDKNGNPAVVTNYPWHLTKRMGIPPCFMQNNGDSFKVKISANFDPNNGLMFDVNIGYSGVVDAQRPLLPSLKGTLKYTWPCKYWFIRYERNKNGRTGENYARLRAGKGDHKNKDGYNDGEALGNVLQMESVDRIKEDR